LYVHSTENCPTCAALPSLEDAVGACRWHPNPDPQKAIPLEQALWSLGNPACVRHLCEADAAALLCYGHVTDAGTALHAAQDAVGAWQQLPHQRAWLRHLLAAQVQAPWNLGIPGSCHPQRLADAAHLLLLFSAVDAAGAYQQHQHLAGWVHLRQKCKQNERNHLYFGCLITKNGGKVKDKKPCSILSQNTKKHQPPPQPSCLEGLGQAGTSICDQVLCRRIHTGYNVLNYSSDDDNDNDNDNDNDTNNENKNNIDNGPWQK